ncbi:Sugar (and other) transporter [Ascochyta rabiei]|uniref:Sugar (and other) transporter n=1 Tax=Didymella rabiei TaxID=5454 RepID=UPI00220AB999|nr:Sugar (and other) transporter [Ascochyta rabiei]UPX09320.1 Sugar (and other) transporter [Ascochyta rabiei]
MTDYPEEPLKRPTSNIVGTVETAAEGNIDLLVGEDDNPALAAKIHLINDAIDEIGWTGFHWKLFFLNGFGYAVDSMVLILQGIIANQAYLEIGDGGYQTGLTFALYAGLLVGALFWGFGADIIGRRIAFNITLFIASMACIVAGASPNWGALGFFISLIGFGAGGNLILDSTVFLEFLPSDKQWAITALAGWWGLGQALPGFIAWGIFVRSDWSCTAASHCTWENNKGWGLIMFISGAFFFVLSLLRLVIIRLQETPKFLVNAGRDEELVENLQGLAAKYGRSCSLTIEQLKACGESRSSIRKRTPRGIMAELTHHVAGLFATRKLALSTSLVWLSWTMIGLAYPLFYVFLP